MKNILKGFALAISMLTILPFFRVHKFFDGINGYAVMFYPIVGLIVGCLLVTFHNLLAPFVNPIHLGVLLLGMWVLLTGALHLDGFSDTIDGLYVAKEKALEVMKDPHNGGMGMLYSVVFLLLKTSSVVFLISDFPHLFYMLPVILMLARYNASLAIYLYPYISNSGIASLAKKEFELPHLILISILVLAIGMWVSWVLILSSLIVLFVIAYIFLKRYGGFTGDIYGFLIETTELVLLNIILFGFIF
jgi:adenosylcobinamide-GDP ribazoletransferase